MPHFVVNKINDALNEQRRSLNGATVLLLGIAYKSNVSDVRESPALDIIQSLRDHKAVVLYNDDFVPSVKLTDDWKLHSQPLSSGLLQAADCVALITDHQYYDIPWIVSEARAIVDTRNMTRGMQDTKIVRL
jgi:UDP-N-acetyl-D-glucosamine dehydrogenase